MQEKKALSSRLTSQGTVIKIPHTSFKLGARSYCSIEGGLFLASAPDLGRGVAPLDRALPRGFSRVAAAFSSYDGDLSLPLGLALGSPIFPSGGLRGKAGGGARVTAGPKRPHLSVCPGPNFPLHAQGAPRDPRRDSRGERPEGGDLGRAVLAGATPWCGGQGSAAGKAAR